MKTNYKFGYLEYLAIGCLAFCMVAWSIADGLQNVASHTATNPDFFHSMLYFCGL